MKKKNHRMRGVLLYILAILIFFGAMWKILFELVNVYVLAIASFLILILWGWIFHHNVFNDMKKKVK